jgi:hypothetical protein
MPGLKIAGSAVEISETQVRNEIANGRMVNRCGTLSRRSRVAFSRSRLAPRSLFRRSIRFEISTGGSAIEPSEDGIITLPPIEQMETIFVTRRSGILESERAKTLSGDIRTPRLAGHHLSSWLGGRKSFATRCSSLLPHFFTFLPSSQYQFPQFSPFICWKLRALAN